jgi:protocatechuate 3,4-dioxygenase beta subunit
MSRRLLLLLPLLPLIAYAQPARLEGTAVNIADGQPMTGVHVRLISLATGVPGDIYGAMSDSAGHFSMAQVAPGAYVVAGERSGFVAARGGSFTNPMGSLTLKPGQNLTDFKLEMTARAFISGRLLDPEGDPLPHFAIRIQPATDRDGPFEAMGGGYTNTNDLGEFRIGGRPGHYIVEALNPNGNLGGRMGPPEIRTDGTALPNYVPTYYPSGTSKDHATAIEAKAGGEVQGIEIRMSRQQGFSLSGQVSGLPSGNTRAFVSIFTNVAESAFVGSSASTVAEPQGRFAFSGLLPGEYTIFAQWSADKTILHSQVQKIQLSGTDVSGVVMSLGPAGEINGVLEIAGTKPGQPPTHFPVTPLINVRFNPISFQVYELQTDPGRVDREGAFHITGIAPVHYHFEIAPLPENAYVKTVLQDGVAVSKDGDNELDLSEKSSANIKIIVGLNGGQISGVVRDKEGSAMIGGNVSVYLDTDAKEPKTSQTARIKPNGTYLLQGVRPGKYRLFAVDRMKTAGRPDRKVALELGPKGELIEAKEGDRISKDLTPANEIAKEAPSAK